MKRKPHALRVGDTVAVVAPSGIVDRQRLDEGIAAIESLGLKVKVMGSVLKQYGYLAGEDRDRARDFQEAWTDPGTHAVMAARGGYGAGRMMRYLDFRLLAPHKKVFMGYSDITALHLALWKKLRLVTFHGPMVQAGLHKPFNLEGVRDALFRGGPRGELRLPEGGALKSLSGGYAKGDLVGGNLSLVAASIGTPFEIDTKGKVLFLEEVGEAPYRVDRMLCQLEAAGKLNQAAAFLLGDFTDCTPKEGSASLSLDEVLKGYLAGRGKPCLSGVPAGHGEFNATLPLGVRVAVDGDSPRLVFLERAAL